MKRVIGIGAGGHARVVLESLRLMPGIKLVGLLDRDPALRGKMVGELKVLGGDELLDDMRRDGIAAAFIGVGSVGDATARIRIYEQLKAKGFEVISARHPSAVISSSALLAEGVLVMPGVIVNPGADVGVNVILNTACVIEHDCRIGDHAHVAPGACLAGNVAVGRAAHIGLGARICQNLSIGEGAMVGAGAVVIRAVPAQVVVAGVPAQLLREMKR